MSESQTPVAEFLENEPPRPVRVSGRDYTMREMSDADLAAYMKSLDERVVTDPKGNRTGNYEGYHSDLISLCLYDSRGARVAKQVIQSWGAKVKMGLFAIGEEMNGIGRGPVKNSSGATPNGSATASPNSAAGAPAA